MEENEEGQRPNPVDALANALGLGPDPEGSWAADVSQPTIESHIVPIADRFKAAAYHHQGGAG